MGDDSSRSIVKSLKKEWALFLEAFQGDEADETKEDGFDKAQVEVLDMDKIRQLTRALTEDRKKINQKLETLNKELDLNSAKLESLRLVGGSEDETIDRIHELNDLGQKMAEALMKLDSKLKDIRNKELEISEA